MGRPEKSVDPNQGPVQRFAYELRKLRLDAGGPTYREMARRTPYSMTALSQAAAGEQLPSLAVTLAYVAACGGDACEWEKRWNDVAAEVAAAPRVADGEEPPYRGLARFEPGDSDVFFGREQLVDDLVELLRTHRCTAVLGPSGSGKSSLLRAGLVPRLRSSEPSEPRPAALRILTPGEHPARTHADKLEPAAGEGDTYVLVDQFEELFTLCADPAEREGFIRRLLAAAEPGSRLRVVLGVRADFYGHCLRHPQLVNVLKNAAVPVGPMGPAELRQAITKPAAARNMIVERALTARLVDELADEPGGLPLLSHALLETWRRRSGRVLTLRAYEAAGGVRGAIAQTAEKVYGSFSPERAELARLILLRLITPGEGAQDTRRPVSRAELDFAPEEEVGAVVGELVGARLLTVDDGTVDVAHEALITAWPRLRGWIDEARESLLVHRRLTDAAHAWHDLGREPGALYRGTRLDAASEQLAESELTALERDFLAAGRAARTTELRRRRGLFATLAVLVVLALVAGVTAWQQNRTSDRRRVEAEARRIAAVADAMRFADPATAMRLSVAAWRLAPTLESRSALLSAVAQPEQDVFPVPGLAFGPSLNRLTADGRTVLSVSARRVVVWDVRTQRRIGSYRGPGGALSDVDLEPDLEPNWGISPDGRLLALPAKGDVRLWDVRAGRVVATLPVGAAVSAKFGVDGRHLTVVDQDGEEFQQTQVWDLRSRRRLSGVRAPVVQEYPTSVSADGRTLALCRGPHRLEIRDLRTGRERHLSRAASAARIACPDQDRYAPGVFALRPGGDVLAAVDDNTIRRWVVRTGRELPRLDLKDATAVRYSADGTFLAATTGTDIVLWRHSEPDQPVFRHQLIGEMITDFSLAPDASAVRYLRQTGTSVASLDLQPVVRADWQKRPFAWAQLADGGRIAAVLSRGPGQAGVRLIDTRSGRTLTTLSEPPCPPDTDSSVSDIEEEPAFCSELMAFSPDGRRFAYVRVWSNSPRRQRITVWDTARHRKVAALDAGPAVVNEITGLAFDAEGRSLLMARGSTGWTLERWDLSTGRRADMRSAGSRLGSSIQAGGSGRLLAVRPDDALVVSSDDEVIDLRARRVRSLVLSDSGLPFAGTFSKDGTRFAVGDASGRVTIWDGELRRRLSVFNGTYTGDHESERDSVGALAFSPDGRTLAVSGTGSVQLWDVASGRSLGSPLPTSGQYISSVAFSDDGTALYASGARNPAERIDLDPERLLRRVCARAGSGLSRADWQTYLPDVPYRRTC
ncbi:DNA-binding protein [Streptomyces sp. NPDC050732]|uniref:nSTAND1 domain-containing NTPase n=1 Tax=Streptomyces sp. NPDC050732 TaxID=3154632 RepID=UPI00343BD2D7